MPIYEYQRPDGTTFEIYQGFEEEALRKDPESGVAVKRVFHAPAVHFKGKGFYNTDYGTRKRQREMASQDNGSSSSSDSAKGDVKAKKDDSGSAAKSDSAGSPTPARQKKGEGGGESPAKKPAPASAK